MRCRVKVEDLHQQKKAEKEKIKQNSGARQQPQHPVYYTIFYCYRLSLI